MIPTLILLSQSNKDNINLQMHYSGSVNNNLFSSQAKSFSNLNISVRKSLIQHSLPHITQPILSKYRNIRQNNELIVQESTSFWCSLFGKSQTLPQISLCKCERTEDNHCQLVMKWISEYYDWKNDPKFVKAYHSYTKRNIEIFLSDSDIESRLQKKLQILGVKLGEKYQQMLFRVCKNYLKHTIYYGKSELLTRQNDLWMWFAIGIFYHVGSSPSETPEANCEEEIIFWSLDIVMDHFENLTRPVFQYHINRIMNFMKDYFPQWYSKLVQKYRIDLQPIVYEWTNEMMMGYMGIESIGFYIDCILKKGWLYVQKIILSYFQKRVERMEHDQLFDTVQDKEVITRQLLNCNEEWPLIFCNSMTFCFQNQETTTF